MRKPSQGSIVHLIVAVITPVETFWFLSQLRFATGGGPDSLDTSKGANEMSYRLSDGWECICKNIITTINNNNNNNSSSSSNNSKNALLPYKNRSN